MRTTRPRARRRTAGRLILPLLAASLPVWLALPLGGCGPRPPQVEQSSAVAGYLAGVPSLAGVDPSPLRGRRILLDPGHGGVFRGAVGPGGLSEAEINLGVALYLQGLLQWASAEVHLTRTADVDFLSPADSSLVADLAARVAICDSLQPDVLLSIHHNSTASGDPEINETQTYYPLGRDGADLDLARAIHRRLVTLLEIQPARILPGGFHILRNVNVPAVLGEPAMISHPVIEGRLTLARSLELEAGAYFLGLLDYFAGGVPRWLTTVPDTVNLAIAGEPLVWTFDAGHPQAPGLDPATVAVTSGGYALAFSLDAAARTVTVLGGGLAENTSLELSARNLAGRGLPQQVHWLLRRSNGPWRTQYILDGEPATAGRGLLTYVNEGQDLLWCGELRIGMPEDLAAGSGTLLARFTGRRGWHILTQPLPRLDLLRIGERSADGALAIHAGSAPAPAQLPPGLRWLVLHADRAAWPDQAVPGGGWRLRHPTAGDASPGRLPAEWLNPDWPAIPWQPGSPLWLEAAGCLPLFADAEGNQPWQPERTAPPDTLTWQPLLPALIGKRVALDPRGGGSREEGRGRLGTRGSDLNLQVAGRLAALLRGAGCAVALVREDDQDVADPERVRRADRFGAEFYLGIGRGPGPVQARHHPGSRLGTPWAQAIAAALTRLGGRAVAAAPAYDYVLRHTAAAAVLVSLESPAGGDNEQRLQLPAWQDAEARALLRGIVDLLQPGTGAVQPPDLLASLGPRALAGDRLSFALLDGNFLWLPPGPDANAYLTSWTTGDSGLPWRGDRHLLELHAGSQWQLWSCSRRHEGPWLTQLLLENR